MNHSFISSQIDGTKCGICKSDELAHSDLAICEVCPTVGPVEVFKTMLMCPDCIIKEKNLTSQSDSLSEQRVNAVIEKSRTIDYSIRIREDIFNSETVSIDEIKQAIESDSSIQNKPFELAKQITDRYQHFSKVIFDKQAEIQEASTRQRSIQSYLNQLASQLAKQEREQLKLNDLDYKPIESKPIKVKPVSTAKKFDKTLLVEFANKAGVPLAALQMICVARNLTPEEAYSYLRDKGLSS